MCMYFSALHLYLSVSHVCTYFYQTCTLNYGSCMILFFLLAGSAVAQWLSIRLQSERSRVENLPVPCCVLEQDTLLPESTGNTQEAVAPSRHD